MNILSIYYLMFLTVALTVYYFLPKRVQWFWLLAISISFFVLSCGWRMVPYLLAGILITYWGAIVLDRTEAPQKKKRILILTLVLTLGELAFLKYLNFIPSTGNIIASLFGKGTPFETISILAPLGVSYYTLAIVGYVLDVYWGSQPVQKNLLKHALFTCYFPQMISGPVTRYGSMREVLFSGKQFSYDTVKFGLQRIFWGYFKKLLVAENLIGFIQTIYGAYWEYAGSDLVFATICYAFYLYTDFSGCMDIVLGTSEMFGIYLPENFQRPFFSCTIDEFWRRWHISLGTWFKDYVLYPVLKSDTWQVIRKACKEKWGKKASKSIPTYLGLWVLWLAIGFWHQGSWKYLLGSGIIPGTYLMLGDALAPFFKKIVKTFKINTKCFSYRLFGRIRTFFLMCTIFFVVNSTGIPSMLSALRHTVCNFGVFSWIGTITGGTVSLRTFVVPIMALLAILGISTLEEAGHDIRKELAQQNLVFRWLVYIVVIFAVLLLSPDTTQGLGEFMYAQF